MSQKFTRQQQGCIFDSHHGRFIGEMVQDLALEHGWTGYDTENERLDADHDEYDEAIVEAEEYLNDNCAPEGFFFGSQPDSSDWGLWPICDSWIVIDGEWLEVDDVNDSGYARLGLLGMGRLEYYVAKDEDAAGEAAKAYWKDLAEHDRQEFVCIVGEENLVAWALGEWAGPGSTQVRSLEEWFDLHKDVPEEHWASYDGDSCTVDDCSEELIEQLGFKPTIAYRHN